MICRKKLEKRAFPPPCATEPLTLLTNKTPASGRRFVLHTLVDFRQVRLCAAHARNLKICFTWCRPWIR
jgi:hypothetical protein